MPAKRVVFVCVENSNHGLKAEAFARFHGDESVEAKAKGLLRELLTIALRPGVRRPATHLLFWLP
jgi:hypothetical protein